MQRSFITLCNGLLLFYASGLHDEKTSGLQINRRNGLLSFDGIRGVFGMKSRLMLKCFIKSVLDGNVSYSFNDYSRLD